MMFQNNWLYTSPVMVTMLNKYVVTLLKQHGSFVLKIKMGSDHGTFENDWQISLLYKYM